MQLNQSNFLRFLIQSEPGKPAISNGLRAALALGVPMLIGQFINQRESGLFVGLMAYFVNLANIGGPYQIKAKAMTGATLGIAVSVFVATLVAKIPALTVVLAFFWGLASGFASLYGNAGANVGLVVRISFISTIAQPGNLEVAVMRSLLCLIAGGWAMLLSLVMWPFRPYDPVRIALADCLKAIANYIQKFAGKVATPENILEIRKALETARTTLGTTRIGQAARSWMDEQLLVLIQDGDRLLGSVIALIELLETHFQHQQYYAVQQLVDDALVEISIILQAIAKVISRKPASIDLGNLNRIYEALKEQESLQRKAITGSEADYTTLVAFTNLVLMIEKLIKQLEYTAQTAKSLADRSKMSRRDVDTLLLVAGEQRSLLSLLKENLTLDSAIFRHALRIGVSLTVGVILYSVTNLPMGYWVTLTIMLVLKPNLGATFQRFFQRVGGTILGAVLAAVIVANITNKAVLDIIILLTVFFGISLIGFNYGYSVVFLSIFVLLIIDVGNPIGWQFAAFRVLNTLIGAGLAFASHYFIWPNWERDRLPSQLATALRECHKYFSDVMAVYQGTKERDSSIISQRRQTGLAIGNAQASFQGLLREPQMHKELVEPVMTLLVYMGRFTNAVTVLAVHLEHFRATVPLPELETFVRQVLLLLEQLADSIQQEITPLPLPDLEETLHKIQPHLQALRTARIQELDVNQGHTPIRQAVIDYSILDLEIEQIVRRLTAMHSAMVRLNIK
ncbi:FUSC family protein [Nostoc flagelliforme FACHB-838]|uniref:FUSC family protein n=1 Tax=Nostoc flagelliforme FACHB-838 TaxID=2692904 RepID=A0ABR8DX43_9NOSO|nr:FUSC family protein [Nostoc flagelliforme]MBD2533931.1 FUSC family protein [Nostoc flagelliforme FACHB-838]